MKHYSNYIKSGKPFNFADIEYDDGFPEFHTNPGSDIARRTLRALTTVDIINHEMVQIGREIDGGYVLLNYKLEDIEVMYSVGISDDTSFEEHFAYLYPNVKRFEMLDHTISCLPCIGHPKFSWQKKGLGSGLESDKSDLISFG